MYRDKTIGEWLGTHFIKNLEKKTVTLYIFKLPVRASVDKFKTYNFHDYIYDETIKYIIPDIDAPLSDYILF